MCFTFRFISAIACERYIGTFWPLRYKELVTSTRICLVFLFCLGYPLITIAPMIIATNTRKLTEPCFLFIMVPFWVVAFIVGHGFVAIMIMAIIYSSVIRTAFYLQKQVSTMYTHLATGKIQLFEQVIDHLMFSQQDKSSISPYVDMVCL